MIATKQALALALVTLPFHVLGTAIGTCTNNDAFEFENTYTSSSVDCNWLTKNSEKAEKRKGTYCTIGSHVARECALACDACETSGETRGVNQLEVYKSFSKAFVGLNPKLGNGSGFIIRDIKNGTSFGNTPDSGGPRVDLCTCDCKAGDDGVGCTGTGGVNFRYSSVLWTDPFDGRWTGQMQAYQAAGVDLHFLGSDTRLHPGGPAIYNVACTQQDCSDAFSGVFRQANGPVSCDAGILDKEKNDSTTCFQRCGNSQTYTDWLAYCTANEEDKSSGYSGYGV